VRIPLKAHLDSEGKSGFIPIESAARFRSCPSGESGAKNRVDSAVKSALRHPNQLLVRMRAAILILMGLPYCGVSGRAWLVATRLTVAVPQSRPLSAIVWQSTD
jgi:hypothetical protein